VVDYFTEVKADHIGFDVARAAGRITREIGTPAVDHGAAHTALDRADASTPRDDGIADPFQPAPNADSQSELTPVP
jgi:hypothetical protein